jgi:hypothetical protein
MRARLLASMGRLDVVQGKIDGGQVEVKAGHQDQSQRGGQQDQWWPPLPPGTQAPPPPPVVLPPNVQSHGQARQAAAVRQQAPVIHRLATPATGSTARQQAPVQMGNPTGVQHRFPPGMATAAANERPQNPFSYVAPHYRPQQQQHYVPPGYGAEQAFGFQGASSYVGMSFMGQQFGQCQQREGENARQPIRFPATPLTIQPYQVKAACSWTVNCRPELPLDRI